jgi:hypothetical protein
MYIPFAAGFDCPVASGIKFLGANLLFAGLPYAELLCPLYLAQGNLAPGSNPYGLQFAAINQSLDAPFRNAPASTQAVKGEKPQFYFVHICLPLVEFTCKISSTWRSIGQREAIDAHTP